MICIGKTKCTSEKGLFLDSAGEPRSRSLLLSIPRVFVVVVIVILYSSIVEYAFV